jgi:hypothetical protein
MGRFLRNLKQKTIAGANGPSSAELRDSGQTIFLDSRNLDELDELIMVQRAHELQHLFGNTVHPGLSTILSTTIDDSGSPVTIAQPLNNEVIKLNVLALKNTSGGTATVTISITDGITMIPLVSSLSVSNGATVPLLSPLAYDGSTSSLNTPFELDSTFYLVGQSDAEVTALSGLRMISLR